MKSARSMCIILVFLILIIGCASKKPVLYPNNQMKQVGDLKAQEEIDACLRLAEESGAKAKKGKKIAKNTAGAAAIGGASGLAWVLFLEMPANMPVRVPRQLQPELWSMGR